MGGKVARGHDPKGLAVGEAPEAGERNGRAKARASFSRTTIRKSDTAAVCPGLVSVSVLACSRVSGILVHTTTARSP